jgi:hypothetical protein
MSGGTNARVNDSLMVLNCCVSGSCKSNSGSFGCAQDDKVEGEAGEDCGCGSSRNDRGSFGCAALTRGFAQDDNEEGRRSG